MWLRVGADVPFFIHGKPALVTGIGETMESFGGLSPHPLVLIFPGIEVSTADVYKNLNLALTKCKNTHIHRDLSNRKFNVSKDLCNDLEAVAASRCPDILAAKQSLVDCGALGALMSGSGSSVFGIFPDREKAEKSHDILLQHEGWQIFLAEVLV
jgi:4-diphosphocytidyl-2-C-methyl-D-erythritol kinase